MKLIYDIDDTYMAPPEAIRVKIFNFEYEVDDTGDYEELKKKYYTKALAAAAYKQVYEYADFMVRGF